jgi:hypothetical protein
MDECVASLRVSADFSSLEIQSSTPPAKRVRMSGDDEGKDNEGAGGKVGSAQAGLDSLHPVRLVLHSFIIDCDMYRILRLRRSTARSLLDGYAMKEHVVQFESGAEVRAGLQKWKDRGVLITRCTLPVDFNESLLVDDGDGRTHSLLPSSLRVLLMGMDLGERRLIGPHRARLFRSGGPLFGFTADRWGKAHLGKWIDRIEAVSFRSSFELGGNSLDMGGEFNCPLPPGSIPDGVQRLKMGPRFDQPLQVGSIPSSVWWLEVGEAFNQPLGDALAHTSITHLLFGYGFQQSLQPGQLPSTLTHLHLERYNQPLPAGVLPPSLQQLDMGRDFNHPLPPGCIPSSVTHLKLSNSFNQPLQPGSIPEGVVQLVWNGFGQTLMPGLLPSSLRTLRFNKVYERELGPGCFPPHLEALALPVRYRAALVPGVIPPSCTVLVLDEHHSGRIEPGAIPDSVEYLRLPRKCARQGVVPRSVEVVEWYN